MKILFDIGHPAHVHLFRNAMNILESKGHELKITARNKDITLELLNNYGFAYSVVGTSEKGMVKKALNMLVIDYNLLKVAKYFKPDLIISTGSPYAAHISRMLRKPHICFSDTEHASIVMKLTFPFTDVICTPSCFKKDLGPKQIRYNGYHELAYLHPNYFTPDPSVLDEIGLKEGERFIIMRFVAWDASHDVGHTGMNIEMQQRFVSELEKYGQVLITSESELPIEFEPYRVKVAPEKMHDLLYYAALYVGEGGTMATEAGILGTPSIYISSLVGTMGNFEELEDKYGLVYSFREHLSALNAALKILENSESKEEWNAKRKILLDETNDVTPFIVKNIEELVKM